MDHKNRVLITEIIVQLHELYNSLEGVDHAAGVDRVADLLCRLREVEGATVRRGGGSGGRERRVPGIVTTDDEPPLREQLSQELEEAAAVRIASVNLSGSDTDPIINTLRSLTERSKPVPVRVLTSVMGFFNCPTALRAFRDWPGLDLRLYHERPQAPEELLSGRSRGFHANTMLIQKRPPPRLMLVSSANLTAAGLDGNVEWNYLSDFEVNVGLGDQASPYERAVQLFDEIWEHRSFQPDNAFLDAYEELYPRGRRLRRDLALLSAQLPGGKEAFAQKSETSNRVSAVTPRPAQ